MEISLQGRRAVLATMHGKEQAIAPVLGAGLGLKVETVAGFDTDRFGTFSREIARTGSQREAAQAKIDAILAAAPDFDIALASEGSFGPDPALPFVALAIELVMLVDRRSGLALTGTDIGYDCNFDHCQTDDIARTRAFAERIGFPAHGLLVMGIAAGAPAPELGVYKEITSNAALDHAVQQTIARCGAVHLETDMRAHRNPTRMKAIARAAQDLVRRFHQCCPRCCYPGYDVVERIGGLPCQCCGEPTPVLRFERLACTQCGQQELRPVAQNFADPAQCSICNP